MCHAVIHGGYSHLDDRVGQLLNLSELRQFVRWLSCEKVCTSGLDTHRYAKKLKISKNIDAQVFGSLQTRITMLLVVGLVYRNHIRMFENAR